MRKPQEDRIGDQDARHAGGQGKIVLPPLFQYMIVCKEAACRGGAVTIGELVGTITAAEFPAAIPVSVVLGVTLTPETVGRPLSLTGWRLDRRGEREVQILPRGKPLRLPPSGLGSVFCHFPVVLPILAPGFYSLDLLDPDHVFLGGPNPHPHTEPQSIPVLARYIFCAKPLEALSGSRN